MAEHTNIAWTDATVNFWWGCTKVSPGCDYCYAERWSKRTGEALWGTRTPRRKIKSAVSLLHRLDNQYADWAADRACAIGTARAYGLPEPVIARRQRAFVQSMSDLFDTEVPIEWFAEAWGTVESCNRISIQILTKRISAVEKRLAQIGCTTWPQHAGLMITVVNQAEADRDIPRLLALKERLGIPWVGISVEPMLGPVDISGYFERHGGPIYDAAGGQMDVMDYEPGLDWVICGGESGPGARPMHPDWVRSLRDQCQAAGVPFFFKQWGEWAPYDRGQIDSASLATPGSTDLPMQHFGKRIAGRLLDGREWLEMPHA